MNYSSRNELSTPLVGTLPQKAAREEDATMINLDANHINRKSKDADADADGDVPDEPMSCCEHNIMTAILYFLLFLQFGISCYLRENEGLQMREVGLLIALLIVATQLYRMALADIGVSRDFFVLLPEIVVVASMCITSSHHFAAAYLLLVLGKFCLSLTVICINAYQLCFADDNDDCSGDDREEILV